VVVLKSSGPGCLYHQKHPSWYHPFFPGDSRAPALAARDVMIITRGSGWWHQITRNSGWQQTDLYHSSITLFFRVIIKGVTIKAAIIKLKNKKWLIVMEVISKGWFWQFCTNSKNFTEKKEWLHSEINHSSAKHLFIDVNLAFAEWSFIDINLSCIEQSFNKMRSVIHRVAVRWHHSVNYTTHIQGHQSITCKSLIHWHASMICRAVVHWHQ